jgi:hypothetical protein
VEQPQITMLTNFGDIVQVWLIQCWI